MTFEMGEVELSLVMVLIQSKAKAVWGRLGRDCLF